MLPESPTFYKVTSLVSMCCMATLVLLLVCVQPQKSLRFRQYRGQELRASAPEPDRNLDYYGSRQRKMHFRERIADSFDNDDQLEKARISDDSTAQMFRAIMRQNAMLANSLQCKTQLSTSILCKMILFSIYRFAWAT